MHQEADPAISVKEVSSVALKRPIQMAYSCLKARLEADGTLAWVHSSEKRGLLFGRSSLEVFKLHSQLRVPLRQRESRVRLHPFLVEFASAGQEGPSLTQSLQIICGEAHGVQRRINLANRGASPLRLRLLSIHDPTSMNFRRERDPPGEVGVNAFNRGDHVVMDDVGDGTGVRVIGFSPRPSMIYMTKDRQRAIDLSAAGEVPESTAGISGPLIILAQQEVDLAPGSSEEVVVTSLYHPSSLEVVLPLLSATIPGVRRPAPRVVEFVSSSPPVNFAFAWARASLDAIEAEEDPLERIAAGFALSVMRPAYLEEAVDSARRAQGRDGFVWRSGAFLETSLLVLHASSHLLRRRDKKLMRRWFPMLRRAAAALGEAARSGMLHSEGAPTGWRRRLGSGFPTGCLFEVNLIAASALASFARVAQALSRGRDSGEFREASTRVLNAMRERLRDPETGSYALNLDPRGRIHREVTIDQAVALSYHPIDQNFASSIVHRLLEKDFETGFGPRCVPRSNPLYYSPTYGEGQLGGYWTRAAIAHAILAYEAGYSSIGSLQLEKVARLVFTESDRMGGVPGEFPYWVDPERRVVGGIGSDPVAAARFIEALLVGELGVDRSSSDVTMRVPRSSQLGWFLLHGLDLSGTGSLFAGRASGRLFVATTFTDGRVPEAPTFQDCELVVQDLLRAALFWGRNSLLICVGNSSATPVSSSVSLPLRGKLLERSLFAEVEELSQDCSGWRSTGRVKLADRVEVRVEVRPSSWKAYRLTQITS